MSNPFKVYESTSIAFHTSVYVRRHIQQDRCSWLSSRCNLWNMPNEFITCSIRLLKILHTVLIPQLLRKCFLLWSLELCKCNCRFIWMWLDTMQCWLCIILIYCRFIWRCTWRQGWRGDDSISSGYPSKPWLCGWLLVCLFQGSLITNITGVMSWQAPCSEALSLCLWWESTYVFGVNSGSSFYCCIVEPHLGLPKSYISIYPKLRDNGTTLEPLSNDHPHQRPSLSYDHISCDGQCFMFVYESLTSDHPSYTTTPMWFWGRSYKRGSTVQSPCDLTREVNIFPWLTSALLTMVNYF